MSQVLQLEAKQDHLVQIASTRDPIKALAEFVWNSLDADAKVVEVEFPQTALGEATVAIVITDDGTGIDEDHARNDFAGLGDSWKRTAPRTKSTKRAMHGKEGRGRLRFYSLADKANWTSIYRAGDELWQLSLEIDATALAKSRLSDPAPASADHTGTRVELTSLKPSLDWLRSDLARQELTTIFAPYLLLYPDITIRYAGKTIDTKEAIAQQYDFPPTIVVAPGRTLKDLSMKVIEWTTADGGRRINLGKENGVVLGSVPAAVIAPEFNFSAYAYSAYFQELADQGLLELSELTDPVYTSVLKHVRDTLSDYFRRRHSERAGSLIDELKASGAYPYEGEPIDEIETRERQVFDIATYTVASFSRDFKQAESSVQKIALTLMKEAIRHNPESLINILRAVVHLPKNRQDEFSSLLEKTELGNIIAASSLVAGRIVTLGVLNDIVFNPKYRDTIKERGELDVLVRDNTWIFGEHFHITVPEAGLTKVMQRVAQDLGTSTKTRKVRKQGGGVGRIDQMLGRRVPHPDPEKREYILVELKRPSLALTKKHLDQVEEYLVALSDQPDFKHTDTAWSLYLVGASYDDTIRARITQTNRPVGLFLDGANFKIWVKTWAEVLRESEGRLRFVQERLKISVAADEIETRIVQLRQSVLRSENRKERETA